MEVLRVLIASISLVLGGLLATTSTVIWVGYSIYEMVKTEQGFFEIVLPNAGYWLLQTVVGIILLTIAKVTSDV